MINENEKLITIATSFVCLLLFVCICIWLVKNVHVNQWEQENWNDRSNSTICWVFSVKKNTTKIKRDKSSHWLLVNLSDLSWFIIKYRKIGEKNQSTCLMSLTNLSRCLVCCF